jgi:hypothetical protein
VDGAMMMSFSQGDSFEGAMVDAAGASERA